MFRFNKNDELLETIERQKTQISRYESRLRDLVSAYKSLQNEKQALESSVKALTTSHASSPSLGKKLKSTPGSSKLSVSSQNSSRRSSIDVGHKKEIDTSPPPGTETESDADNVPQAENETTAEARSHSEGESSEDHSDSENSAELDKLRHQIATLTVSLSTVMEEKSKIVATYQAEKKKLKQETEVQIMENTKHMDTLKTRLQNMEEELVSAKDRIRSQQEDREQEQSTHSIMLRELQKMLNDERLKTEELSCDLQEARRATQKAESEFRKSESTEKQVKKLMEELDSVNEKLKLAKEEAHKPSPVLVELQNSVAEMKAAHRVQFEKEHLRAVEAEEKLKRVSEESEERVSSLEEQITQLSNQMGKYESTKTKERMVTIKLRERLVQVETENSILAKQVANKNKGVDLSGSFDEEVETLDLEELKNQIVKFKGLLKVAAQRSDDPIDVEGWFASLNGRAEDDYQKLYLEAQQELRQTKDEFEKYKIRAQNVLKGKRDSQVSSSGRESISSIATERQIQHLKNELEETRERHFHLRSHCDGLEERQKLLVKEHEEEMLRKHLAHQKKLEEEKEVYSSKIHELEQEMRSQRERTVALLAEKDKEIEHLQAYSTACHRQYQSEYAGVRETRLSSSSSRDYSFYGSEEKEPALDSVTEIMNKGSGHDTTMIHYAEQMARKDVSINGLRRQKKQLELQIRQLQDAIMMKDEKNSREIAILHEKIADFGRNKTRENANLEYLKNVMFQYLTTKKDQSARSRMLQAVITILQFSPDETKKVLRTK